MNIDKKDSIKRIICLLCCMMLYISSLLMPFKEVCTCQNQFCVLKEYNFFNKKEIDFDISNTTINIVAHRGNRLLRYKLKPIFTSEYFSHNNVVKDYSLLLTYKKQLGNDSFINKFKLVKVDCLSLFSGPFFICGIIIILMSLLIDMNNIWEPDFKQRIRFAIPIILTATIFTFVGFSL